MKNLIIFTALFVSQLGGYCVAQVVIFSHSISANYIGESSIQNEFNQYLDLILSYDSDTIMEVDTSVSYKIKYVTYHKVNFPQDFKDSLYADSLKLICISNPTRVQDSIMQLTFLDTDTLFFGQTRLTKEDSMIMQVFTYRKLNPNTGAPYNGSASFHFDAEVSRLLSLNSGQYLLIGETRFTPEIRGGMPPGTSVTYYLEIIK